MSIVIETTGAFEIDSYGGLQAYIARALDRVDLVAEIPNFIHHAEMRLQSVLTPPDRQGTAQVATVAATATVSLPTDFSQMLAVNIAGSPLEQVSIAALYEGWNGAASAEPRVYSINNTTLRLAPVPDAVYTVAFDYIQDIVPLSDAAPSNWVLVNHGDLLYYGALLQAEAYLSNDDRIALWKMAFDEGIAEVNAAGIRHRRGASPLRLRSPVCV
jgi:hypothetical protein